MTGQISTTKSARSRFPATADEELWFARPFSAQEVFGRRAPLEIELGTGKARFLIAAAGANPSRDFVGVERSLSYYRIARRRITRARLPNARIVRADARMFVEGCVAAGSVRAFHVYFPDPWPKTRHRHRRLFGGNLAGQLRRTLVPGGAVHLASDLPALIVDLSTRCVDAGLVIDVDGERRGRPTTVFERKYAGGGTCYARLVRPANKQSGFRRPTLTWPNLT